MIIRYRMLAGNLIAITMDLCSDNTIPSEVIAILFS